MSPTPPLPRLLFLCFAMSASLCGADLMNEPIRVACVGDSITYGAGIKDRENKSYPAQLQAMLGNRYKVANFGVNGATLLKQGNKPYWELKAFNAAREFQPDLVIIKLGTNDSKSVNWKHADQFEADYVELIKVFQQLESQPTVLICRPVPAFSGRFGIDNKVVLEEVIPRVHAVAEATGVNLVDLNEPMSGKPELFGDTVHPNAEGARVIAETLKAAIETLDLP